MRRSYAVLVALALSTACSDSATGPSTGAISAAEASAVSSAFGNAGSAGVGTAGPLALVLANRVGTVSIAPVLSVRMASALAAAPGGTFPSALAGSYRTVGVLLNTTLTHAGAPPTTLALFALVAWNGFNPVTGEVENALVVGTSSPTAYPANGSGVTGTVEGGQALATFVRRATNTGFEADTGAFTVSNWSSAASAGCGPTAGTPVSACSFAVGQMSGSFGFSGPATTRGNGVVRVPVTTFTNLPLVLLNVTIAVGP